MKKQGDLNMVKGFRTGLILLMAGFAMNVFSQGNVKQEAEITKLRVQVERARLAQDKQERKEVVADSLIGIGTTMLDESSVEIKAAENVMKTKNKEYSSQRKALEKRLKSDSKEELLAAKAEIKALDAAHKAEVKAHDLLMKTQTKKSIDGTKNLDKGKLMKKEATRDMKETSRALTNAQFALEDATEAPAEEEPAKGKKGKKQK